MGGVDRLAGEGEGLLREGGARYPADGAGGEFVHDVFVADDGVEQGTRRREHRIADIGLRRIEREAVDFGAGDRLAIRTDGEGGSFATAFDENDGRYRVFGCFSNSFRAFFKVS